MDAQDEVIEVENESTETPVELPEGEGNESLSEEAKPEEGSEAEEAGAAEADAEADTESDGESGEESETPAANIKFKASVFNKETKQLEQKEFEIDKQFHGLMKTPEGEKLVRELHEKAFGLDSVKERLTETRALAQNVQKENVEFRSSVDGLKRAYQSAVAPGGNILKLDKFFQNMNINPDVIMQYAIARARLTEMPEEQRNAVLGQLNSETQAEQLAQQQTQFQQENQNVMQQMKVMQLQMVVQKPEVSSVQQSFDAQYGEGSFMERVAEEGNLAWYQSGGKVDLTPEQAVAKVFAKYKLSSQTETTTAPAKTVVPGNGLAQKQSVQQKAKTIPNVAGRTASPLKEKPRSIEDIKKISKERYG